MENKTIKKKRPLVAAEDLLRNFGLLAFLAAKTLAREMIVFGDRLTAFAAFDIGHGNLLLTLEAVYIRS